MHDAIRRGVAIYSPHTAWDVAEGGTNDLLADAVGLAERAPLRIVAPAAKELKLVTFVPGTHIQAVSSALFAAGAGHIGNYSSCSFRTAGVGTFLGEAGSNPTVGQAGRLETANEIRLETILPLSKVAAVVAALKSAHPYEEAAFDLNTLATPPTGSGQGRIGDLPHPKTVSELASMLKQALGLSALLIAGEENRSVKRVAMCAGAGGELLDDAIRQNANLFLTGELRHHDALKAINAGMATICTLHSNSERPSLMRLKSRLTSQLESHPDSAKLPQVLVSQMDRDPFVIR
jgi:putative NIF3 family GTP cyclohydrolase 1 type 2